MHLLILVQRQSGPPAFADFASFALQALTSRIGARRVSPRRPHAIGQEPEPVGIPGGGLDHGIEQAWKASLQILTAEPQEAIGPRHTHLHHPTFAQFGEVVSEVRLSAEIAEIATAQFPADTFLPSELVDDSEPDRIAQAIQDDRQLDLLSGGMRRRAAHGRKHSHLSALFNRPKRRLRAQRLPEIAAKLWGAHLWIPSYFAAPVVAPRLQS